MIALVLAACITVEGDSIRAADLARAVPAFASTPAEAVLAPAPGPGGRRTFSPRELAVLAVRFGVPPSFDTEVCFELFTEPLTRERAVEALRAAGAPEPIELLDFSRSRVPRGALEFEAPARGDTWRGRVRYGANRNVPVWARVRLHHDVERGDAVTVTAASGEARLTLVARAQSAGRAGDIIALRREDNQRTLRARVTGKGRAIVDADVPAARTVVR